MEHFPENSIQQNGVGKNDFMLRQDSLTVFQAQPLVWFDHDGNCHPLDSPDFAKEKRELKEAIDEANKQQQGFGKVHVLFEEASIGRLGACLATGKSPVLHFSCHGDPSFLAIENKGAMQAFLVQQLRAFVAANEGRLKLVFVSACHSRPAGDAFLAAGVDHVVCCKTDARLRDAAAGIFAQSFYQALACQRKLKAAFNIARQAVLCSPDVVNAEMEMNNFLLLPEKPDNDPHHDVDIFFTGPTRDPRMTCILPENTMNLPPPPQVLFGRQVDMYNLAHGLVLDSVNPRLFLVWGPKGIGKGSLAKAVCGYVVDRRRTFSVDNCEWVSPEFGTSSTLSAILKELYEMIQNDNVKEVGCRAMTICMEKITSETYTKRSVIAIDARELTGELAMKKLDRFLFNLLLWTRHVRVIVVCPTRQNYSFSAECLTKRISLGPLDLQSSLKLFGNYCDFVEQGRVRGVRSSGDLADLLDPETPHGCENPRAREISATIGEGIPSKIREIATKMSAARYDDLMRIGVHQLQEQINAISAKLRSVSSTSESKELKESLRHLMFARDSLPSVSDLTHDPSELVPSPPPQPHLQDRTFEENQNDTTSLSSSSSMGSVIGFEFSGANMDENIKWSENIIRSKRNIEKLLQKLLRYGDLLYGEACITVETIESYGRERAVVSLDCEIKLHDDLAPHEDQRVREIFGKIVRFLKKAGASEDELEDMTIGAVYKGSLVLLLEAPPAVFKKLFRAFMRGGGRIMLSKSDAVYISAISPAFLVKGPFALLQEKEALQWQGEIEPDAVVWKEKELSLLIPTAPGSFKKLMTGGIPIENWQDISDAALKDMPLILPIRLGSSLGAPLPKQKSFDEEYEWGAKLGRGSFSVIHKSIERSSGTSVAMKRYSLNQSIERSSGTSVAVKRYSLNQFDREDLTALREELRVLQAVQGTRYIVHVNAIFEEPDFTYVVMELTNGGDLMGRILKKTMYAEEEARTVCQSLLKGVEYMHSKDIAHRNLKPENVLLVSQESDTDVRICDFGLAQKITHRNSLRTQCGTEGYVAPEILKDRPAYDRECDMWSLGVVFYILLAGYRPFRGTGAVLSNLVQKGDYRFDKKYWSRLSEEAEDLVASLLLVDPAMRASATRALQCPWFTTSENIDNVSKQDSESGPESAGMQPTTEQSGAEEAIEPSDQQALEAAAALRPIFDTTLAATAANLPPLTASVAMLAASANIDNIHRARVEQEATSLQHHGTLSTHADSGFGDSIPIPRIPMRGSPARRDASLADVENLLVAERFNLQSEMGRVITSASGNPLECSDTESEEDIPDDWKQLQEQLQASATKMNVMAPAGKLGIILANKADSKGTVVSRVRTSSILVEKISPGDQIVAIDGEDVSRMTVSEITTIMARKSDFERALTVLKTPKHQTPSSVTTTDLHGDSRAQQLQMVAEVSEPQVALISGTDPEISRIEAILDGQFRRMTVESAVGTLPSGNVATVVGDKSSGDIDDHGFSATSTYSRPLPASEAVSMRSGFGRHSADSTSKRTEPTTATTTPMSSEPTTAMTTPSSSQPTSSQPTSSATHGDNDDDELQDVLNQPISDSYNDSGQYTGSILTSTGMPHGVGKMLYNDGRTYVGDWRHGRFHGFGKVSFENGDSYQGEYRFDNRHGRGLYKWSDGRTYEGEFSNDKRHGRGTFQWPDGSNYDGEFIDGKREGQGIYVFSDGGYYTGGWLGGFYEGYGECEWADGRSYKGEWKQGKAHGRGVETNADGTVRHDGMWENDAPVHE